jgi:hypothetical protein
MGFPGKAKFLGVRLPILVPCVALVGGALGWTKMYKDKQILESKNYLLKYSQPIGWKSAPHGPQTLFKWVDPKTAVSIRGAANQMVSEVNPSPDLDTENIADFYIDRTHESMPGWGAEKLGKVVAQNGQVFELIRRGTADRTVVTAYTVKGNTTILISLFGMDKAKPMVETELPFFENYLATMALNEKDLSNL